MFVHELDLGGIVRIDIAAINEALWGYEIKSARDTLRRLAKQVEIYSQVLDHAALVVAENHREHAAPLLPSWWEMYVIGGEPEALQLTQVTAGTTNPSVDPLAIAQLLWRDEALAELADRGLDRGVRTKPRRAIWEQLVDHLEVGDFQAAVRSRLKQRGGWRGTW